MSDWDRDLSPEDRESWDTFVRFTREDTVQKMAESAFVMSLVPNKADVDIKFACELGLSIMLDKPLIVVVHPDTPVPARLRMVADKVIEADIDTAEGRDRVAAELHYLTRE